jgi:hypothetical protein
LAPAIARTLSQEFERWSGSHIMEEKMSLTSKKSWYRANTKVKTKRLRTLEFCDHFHLANNSKYIRLKLNPDPNKLGYTICQIVFSKKDGTDLYQRSYGVDQSFKDDTFVYVVEEPEFRIHKKVI